MQTERVTFLTTPDHKAALDAFAAGNGMSVGHVVREASTRYIAQKASRDEELAMLAQEVEAAIPQMRADLDAMVASLRAARADVEAYRRQKKAGS